MVSSEENRGDIRFVLQVDEEFNNFAAVWPSVDIVSDEDESTRFCRTVGHTLAHQADKLVVTSMDVAYGKAEHVRLPAQAIAFLARGGLTGSQH